MTSTLSVLAAGSLRLAFTPLLQRFTQATGIDVEVTYGPAGILRERIEAGEACALFASANRAHPQALLANNKAFSTHTFTWNRLGLTTRNEGGWLDLLRDPTARIGTSTPGCDPCGDYTWALFDKLDKLEPGLGEHLRKRAVQLVGGKDTLSVPKGELASAWIIRQGLADVCVGYAHYSLALADQPDVRSIAIPEEHNILCEYQLAAMRQTKEIGSLVDFILASEGQKCLATAGFLPATYRS
ncbi:substrate-binding domain-containing protein [Cedecea colo]|uniref:Molybdate ABC transporter substrate-binding protein n=1 Tax=Cedecea colo TaxID=2552946 RepID=A0ABX0VRH0_9ENTR|nr:substrate-binding domain-containing protein [Cedecea colo]NIY49351.1 molybdate ABC transporter substrate-binding protein [Cedecea colo]